MPDEPKQMSVKELQRKLNSEKFDVTRIPVFVLMPNDETLPVTNIILVGDDKEKAAYIVTK